MSITKVKLTRKNDNFFFEGENSTGQTLNIDSSADIGGEGKGVRPMEMLLFGVAGCSGIDVIHILKKQRQKIQDLQIEVEGERVKVEEYSTYKSIKVIFHLKGENLDEEKVKRALDLSFNKYCSVSKTLEKVTDISYEYEIH